MFVAENDRGNRPLKTTFADHVATEGTGGDKDWFRLLLEIERRFRAEKRKKLRSECEIMPKPVQK